MSKPRRFPLRSALSLAMAVLQAVPAYAGTIVFSRDGLNARTSNSFKGTSNVLTTVPKGTEGEVLDRWKLPSGNYSVKIKITKLGADGTSLKVDDEVWVYYHRDSELRRIELADDDGKKVANAEAGKWAIALSTFKTAKSEPKVQVKREETCTTCTSNPIGQTNVKPVSSIEIENFAEIIKTVESDESASSEKSELVPTVDLAVEEIAEYMAKDQKKSLKPSHFKKTSAKQNRLIAKTLVDECRKQGVPLELALGMIQAESHFYTHGRSHAGARGLMQIMPITYRDNTDRNDYDRLYDPVVNIKIGVDEIAGYLKRYNGNVEHALGAYNFGPGNYNAYLNGTCGARYRRNGICTLPIETLAYVPAVLRFRDAYVAYGKTSRTTLALK